MNSVVLGAWSRLLFGTLARAGLRDVVVSPGSRSTPFTWAALHSDGLRCHSIPDERSAAFFALGQARVSGRPSAVICTSGSAAAHFFPAVVEASLARIPLLVLSADRPFELMQCGAAQAMDQTKLYGGFVRQFFELGQPDPSPGALDALERMLVQAFALALGPEAGPVHLNARARKPLEPWQASTPEEQDLERAVSERLSRPIARIFHAPPAVSESGLEALSEHCGSAESGLIVCGPLPTRVASELDPLFELARRTGFPLCVETASQARTSSLAERHLGVTRLGAFDAIFATGQPEPAFVLQVGAPPTAGSFERWALQSRATRAVLAGPGFLDPSNRASLVIQADPLAALAALNARLAAAPGLPRESRARFAEGLARRESAYWRAAEAVLAAPSSALGEAQAARTIVEAMPEGALLGLGNSLAIRSVDAFVPPSTRALRVWSQRGVNGIDGLVSGAAGAAHSAAVPSLLLLGDVSLLHDLTGMFAARQVATPLVIAVIDNAGGRIFEDLPIRARWEERPELARFWLTPPEVDFEHAARAFGLRYDAADDVASLRRALSDGLASRTPTLVHARVLPGSARAARHAIHESLQRSMAPSPAQ